MATATATAEKTKPEVDGETEEKGGKKKLLLIVLVVLLAAGGAAYFFLFSGPSTPAPPEKGTVVALDPIAVNLAGGGYLKVGIALQLTADAGAEKPDGSQALDLIIQTFSQANPADVSGARDALKASLEKKIVDAYKKDGTEIVMGIYYTEYVTQ
jgi:flagellar FliL protein